jgi:hypothetical protein
MTNDQLKAAVADKFAESGIWVNKHASMIALYLRASEHTGTVRGPGETVYGYLSRFAGIKRNIPVSYAPAFRPMCATAHPRAAEIDRLPRPISMSGIGIGGNNGMGRGR